MMSDSLDIIFTDGGTIVSKLIMWATWGKWSHVGIINDLEERISVLDTSFPNGVKEQYINDFVKETDKHEIVRVPCTYEQKRSIIAWARSKKGAGYDSRLFFGFLFRSTRFDNKDKYVCSEFVAIPMINNRLINLGNYKARRINPTVLYWLCKTLSLRYRS